MKHMMKKSTQKKKVKDHQTQVYYLYQTKIIQYKFIDSIRHLYGAIVVMIVW